MLIVNADDLGRNRVATDTILAGFQNRRVTSTSAMVFMEDSVRAAELALRAGIDVGLHINFSERLTAPSVPANLHNHHERVRRFLKRSKYALLIYHPFLRRVFVDTFEIQYREFLRLYGREPSHFDGHQHMHLASNMLLQRVIPAGTKVRRSFTFQPGEKGFFNRWYRSKVDGRLARRHRLTDYFFALAQHLSLERLQRVTALAKTANVELMTHPEVKPEFEFLVGDTFGRAITGVQLAGYDVL